jgi:hypothetical protein
MGMMWLIISIRSPPYTLPLNILPESRQLHPVLRHITGLQTTVCHSQYIRLPAFLSEFRLNSKLSIVAWG